MNVFVLSVFVNGLVNRAHVVHVPKNFLLCGGIFINLHAWMLDLGLGLEPVSLITIPSSVSWKIVIFQLEDEVVVCAI